MWLLTDDDCLSDTGLNPIGMYGGIPNRQIVIKIPSVENSRNLKKIAKFRGFPSP
jgi:hypothetical protein